MSIAISGDSPNFTNASLTTPTLTSATLTSATLTSPTINSAPVPTVVGTAPIYGVRAWANFNGTGTPSINASGNVSTVVRSGSDYVATFTTDMQDTNYAVTGSFGNDSGDIYVRAFVVVSKSTTGFTFNIAAGATSANVSFMVIR